MDKLLKPALTMGVVDAATVKEEHIAKPEAKKAPPPKKPVAKDSGSEEVAVFVKPPLGAML
eukprot:CAMPEP_0179275272 /NCGR_PEP_ID=MMETSP0797-20121207/33976_1 /TAXON_ID=47934 /ORGANISM="Dinophysis acuminata, Strain DAEP01" /LENGTH=60 /DNA_ID=CAMNT_0020983791 /DNA_START=9 /DNA_END=188 /DNA_ORIENTATION=-